MSGVKIERDDGRDGNGRRKERKVALKRRRIVSDDGQRDRWGKGERDEEKVRDGKGKQQLDRVRKRNLCTN